MRLLGIYFLSFSLTLISWIALFNLHLLDVEVPLFYRGLAYGALSWLLTFLILALGFAAFSARNSVLRREIFSACAFSFSFILTFLIVIPVTMERSVSVFLLKQLRDAGQQGIEPKQLQSLLCTDYVELGQAARKRMQEQLLSGNVVQEGDRFLLSNQGERFLTYAESVSSFFPVTEYRDTMPPKF